MPKLMLNLCLCLNWESKMLFYAVSLF
jgi:hypothetical protein